MDVQDMSTAADMSDFNGPGQVDMSGPGLGPNAPVDPYAALERPGVPDGVFRILLVVAGAASGASIMELIAALSKVSGPH